MKKFINVYATNTGSAQVNIWGSAFKVIFKVSITYDKSRSEVYNVEYSTSYITTCAIRLATGLIFDRRWKANSAAMLWGLFTRREAYPGKRITFALAHLLLYLRRVYKAARVTRVGGLPYLRAVVTLTGV